MIRNNKLLIITMIFLVLIMFFIPTYSMATGSPIDNPDAYKPGGVNSGDQIISKGSKILNVITVLGVIISVITLTILGIKYMFGSIEEKADYKKSMIPYIIGVVLLIGITTIVGLIANVTQKAL